MTKTDPRLLIVNNLPSFYRTGPFAELADEWSAQTGGPTLCLFQARRNFHHRQEWFFSPDDEIRLPHRFLTQKTIKLGGRVTYVPNPGVSAILTYKPTHLLVAGWDTPVALAAAGYRRSHKKSRLVTWVESNPTTTRHSGRFANRFRRAILRSADATLVPTPASAAYVQVLRERSVPTLEAPNPVDLTRIASQREARATKRMIFLGDLSHRKGFDVFSDACELLKESGWIGEAWGADTEMLASQAPQNCIIHSGTPLHKILPLLRAGDTWVIPSRSDPAPLTFSEAIALGLRTVVSDQIAYKETAALMPGIRMFQGEDPRSLAESLHAVASSPRPNESLSRQFTSRHWAKSVTAFLIGL